MEPFVSDDTTREGDLKDWQAFCVAYYNPIIRCLSDCACRKGKWMTWPSRLF